MGKKNLLNFLRPVNWGKPAFPHLLPSPSNFYRTGTEADTAFLNLAFIYLFSSHVYTLGRDFLKAISFIFAIIFQLPVHA